MCTFSFKLLDLVNCLGEIDQDKFIQFRLSTINRLSQHLYKYVMGRVRVNLFLESDTELSAPRLFALLHFLNIKLNEAMIICQIRDDLISEFSKLRIWSNIN